MDAPTLRSQTFLARCGRRSQLGEATSFRLAQSAEHFLLAVPVWFAGDLAPPSGDFRQSISLGHFFQGLPNGPHSNIAWEAQPSIEKGTGAVRKITANKELPPAYR